MTDETLSLRQCLSDAERQQSAFEVSHDYNSPASQSSLARALAGYEQCLKIASNISLFSSNEELEDVSSGDLRSVPIHYDHQSRTN